jgi:hypothetical protein
MASPFDYLGLTPDADERAIKRAYARLLKTHRPDEDPAAFQRLSDAYEAAMAWWRRSSAIAAPPGGGSPAQSSSASHSAKAPGDLDAPVDAHAFFRLLALQAMKSDADRLRAWLDERPELWSLDFKQAFGGALPRWLAQARVPMPTACFDALATYFDLDKVQRHVDPIALRQLRDELQNLHGPVAQFLSRHRWDGQPGAAFDQKAYLARLRKLWTEGDAQSLHTWLCLEGMVRSEPELRQAAQTLRETLAAEAQAMPVACLQAIGQYFGWIKEGRPEGMEASWRHAGEGQLRWLLSPAHHHELGRVVKPPLERHVDRARTRKQLAHLTHFSRLKAVLFGLLPGHAAQMRAFIDRLREACGLGEDWLEVMARHLDERALRFWSRAGGPEWMSAPRATLAATRLGLVLALALLAYGALGWMLGAPPLDAAIAARIAETTAALALSWLLFDALLFWQKSEATGHPLFRGLHAAFVPAVSAMSVVGAAIVDGARAMPFEIVVLFVALISVCRFIDGDKERLVIAVVSSAFFPSAAYFVDLHRQLRGDESHLSQWLLAPLYPAAMAVWFWWLWRGAQALRKRKAGGAPPNTWPHGNDAALNQSHRSNVSQGPTQ